jgi:hypothetical protein
MSYLLFMPLRRFLFRRVRSFKGWLLFIIVVLTAGPYFLKEEFGGPIKKVQIKTIDYAKGIGRSIGNHIQQRETK